MDKQKIKWTEEKQTKRKERNLINQGRKEKVRKYVRQIVRRKDRNRWEVRYEFRNIKKRGRQAEGGRKTEIKI